MLSQYQETSKCIAVIPSIEGLYLLRRLLPTIDLPKENIIIIDQGSLDGTEEYCVKNGYKVLQLKKRSTFTRAVNIGMEEALKNKADYILVINNDTEFKTNIATQLVSRMKQEDNIGILAPRQIIVDNEKEALCISRVYWNLNDITFNHDIGMPSAFPEILDSDFCEFTCVMLSKNLIIKIGMLDERYEFYHEDADFAFRAQLAGYRCAYDQTAIIRHFQSSTVSKQKFFDKDAIISRNKKYFLLDYIGPQIRLNNVTSPEISSWSVTNEKLYAYLNKYGLVCHDESNCSMSTLAHPEMVNTDYLLTVWETTVLPKKWINKLYKFKHIFVPSQWNADVFISAGFFNVSVVPFGVDTDIFNPWGAKIKFPWNKTVLSICRGQHRKALDVTEKIWLNSKHQFKDTFLVLYGKDTGFKCLDDENFEALVFGPFIAKIYHQLQIAHLIPSFGEYVADSDVATLYRSVDLYLMNSRSEGFGYPVIEAMACGTLCLIPNYGSVREFVQDGNCFYFEGNATKADYRDKGFGEDVGDWWEPNIDDLSEKLVESLSTTLDKVNLICKKARGFVVNNYTWRHTALKLRESLFEIEKSKNKKIQELIIKNESQYYSSNEVFSFERRLLDHLVGQSKQLADYADEIHRLLDGSNVGSIKKALDSTSLTKSNILKSSFDIEKLLSADGKDFIDNAYQVLLGRAPDQQGLDYYFSRLNSGISKIDILFDIRNSQEGKEKAVISNALDEILSMSTLSKSRWSSKLASKLNFLK